MAGNKTLAPSMKAFINVVYIGALTPTLNNHEPNRLGVLFFYSIIFMNELQLLHWLTHMHTVLSKTSAGCFVNPYKIINPIQTADRDFVQCSTETTNKDGTRL